MKASIKSQIILVALLVIAFFGSLATFFVYQRVKAESIDQQKARMLGDLACVNRELNVMFRQFSGEAEQISRTSRVISYLSGQSHGVRDSEISSVLKEHLISGAYEAIILFDLQGVQVASTRGVPLPEGSQASLGYVGIPLKGSPHIEVSREIGSDRVGYYFSHPVFDKEQKVIGVVVLKVLPDLIDVSLDDFAQNVTMTLTDIDGIVISSNRKDRVMRSLWPLSSADLERLSFEYGYGTSSLQGLQYDILKPYADGSEESRFVRFFDPKDREDELLLISKIKGYPFYLVQEKDYEEIATSAFWTAALISVFVAGCAIVAFFGLLLVASWLLKPLRELQNQMEKAAAGDYRTRVRPGGGLEIASLGKSFNAMLDAIVLSRKEVDAKVVQQTRDLKKKTDRFESQRIALANVLEDVQSEKQKAETILQSIGDGVLVLDSERRVLLVNNATTRLSGYSVEEMLYRPYDEVLRFVFEETGEVNDMFVRRVFETGEVQEMSNHTVLIRKDGSKIPVADSAAPLKDVEGRTVGCVVVFHDQTKEREVDRAKTEFVSLASHQLKTPVGAVKWNVEMLLDGDYGELNDKQHEVLQDVYRLNVRMNDLVKDFLNVSRIELGTFMIDPVPVKYSDVCDEVLKELEERIHTKGHEVIKEYDSKMPKTLADVQLLRVIFQNLLSNAVKYTPDHGRIGVRIGMEGKDIRIDVRNNGVLIPESERSKIFQKMYRATGAQEMDPDGNGLGLYLLKSIVDAAGGRVWFESGEGKDTVFSVSFPLPGMKEKKGTKKLG